VSALQRHPLQMWSLNTACSAFLTTRFHPTNRICDTPSRSSTSTSSQLTTLVRRRRCARPISRKKQILCQPRRGALCAERLGVRRSSSSTSLISTRNSGRPEIGMAPRSIGVVLLTSPRDMSRRQTKTANCPRGPPRKPDHLHHRHFIFST
jgi:hypothetical protein